MHEILLIDQLHQHQIAGPHVMQLDIEPAQVLDRLIIILDISTWDAFASTVENKEPEKLPIPQSKIGKIT